MGQRAFAVFLQELRDGRTHIELTTALADLLGKVKDTGKAGSITLQIGVKPAGKGADLREAAPTAPLVLKEATK